MTPGSLPRACDRLLVTAFVLATSLPLVATVAGREDAGSVEEYRTSAPWPAVPHDLASLAAWPDAFTKAFADRFAFRRDLVQAQAHVRVQWLASSPTADVWLGRNGWLFYGTDGAIEDATGTHPFTADELTDWRDTLQHTQDWLDARQIGYLFVIAPDKHWIYQSELPGGLTRHSASRVDQLVTELDLRTSVRFVDLRAPLRQAASDQRVYHRTDTHWNDGGAWVAYREILERIGPPLGVAPVSAEALARRSVTRGGLDLARMLGLGSTLLENDVQFEPRGQARVVEPAEAQPGLMYPRVVTEGAPTGPRALVFRDSFGSAVIPFLAPHFSRAVFVWQNNFDPAIVEAERPDVVVQEWVTRHLYTATPYDAVALRGASRQQ
jgi:hypothetical protein